MYNGVTSGIEFLSSGPSFQGVITLVNDIFGAQSFGVCFVMMKDVKQRLATSGRPIYLELGPAVSVI